MADTTSEGGAALARRFLELAAAAHADPEDAGKREAAFAMLHDDLVIHEPAVLPYGGEYHGREGYVELMNRMDALASAAPAGPVEFHEAGDLVVMRLEGRFTSRASGRSLVTSFVEIYTMREGRIAELDVFVKDPTALAELLAP